MPTHRCSSSHRRTVGEFLCLHPTTPPHENIDHPAPADVKQDAALRALLSLRRLDKPIGDDFVATLNAEPKLAMLAYRWAARDARKRHRHRGRDGRGGLIRSWSDLILDDVRDPFGPAAPAMRRFLGADLPDLAHQALLDAVEHDHPGELLRLWNLGIPGLNRKQTRQVLLLIRLVQVLKDRDDRPLPNHLRLRLSRLRRATGLPLDVHNL